MIIRILLLSTYSILFSQIAFTQSFNVQLSQKHLSNVNKGKSAKQKLKRYHRFYSKDSTKQVKKDKKYWKHKSDSLDRAIANGASPFTQDSSSVDSTFQVKREQLVKEYSQEGMEQIPGYDEEYGKYTQVRDKESGKKLFESESNEWLGKQEELGQINNEASQLQQYQTMSDSYKGDFESYQEQLESLTDKKAQEQAAKEQAEEILVEQSKTLDVLHNAVNILTEKYSKIPNSANMEDAVKRSSLEGKPLKERLFFGGNFNVVSTDPFSLDLTPQIGYKFNKNFIVGTGFVYRNTFSSDSIAAQGVPDNATGYNVFSSLTFFKNFFAYSEFTSLNTSKRNSETISNEAVNGLFVGVGRKISVHKFIDMQVMLLYDFLHKANQPSVTPSPWSFKFGFSIKRTALIKKK